ncbi:hypothetical protein EVAR_64653_1 [Eumeta japonica]|uniref:Ig-like domain-containing protein n=1 Tax=Eumeta variegata TaxID=151549 RepID=A0A4C2A654_EUMVA|nr:hypothetical protein EVAR_64653_1 [Eumeta japonica]
MNVIPAANSKLSVASSDQNRVVLTQVDRSLTGEYQCEVSADAPLFHTDIKAAAMVVVDPSVTIDRSRRAFEAAPAPHSGVLITKVNWVSEPPLASPNVSADRMWYAGGEHIRANCSSPPSLPAANITWYVNEQMVSDFSFSTRLYYYFIAFSRGKRTCNPMEQEFPIRGRAS